MFVKSWLYTLLYCAIGSLVFAQEMFQEGDLIFHKSKSRQSKAIKMATGSDITHVGIIIHQDGETYVFEAISPVSVTPFKEWMSRGRDKKYYVKRLDPKLKVFTLQDLSSLKRFIQKTRGKAYDGLFQWGDKKWYCSELVYKFYSRNLGVSLGRVQKFKDLQLGNSAVQYLIKKRYGKNIDLEEPIITPISMFHSPHLISVN